MADCRPEQHCYHPVPGVHETAIIAQKSLETSHELRDISLVTLKTLRWRIFTLFKTVFATTRHAFTLYFDAKAKQQ